VTLCQKKANKSGPVSIVENTFCQVSFWVSCVTAGHSVRDCATSNKLIGCALEEAFSSLEVPGATAAVTAVTIAATTATAATNTALAGEAASQGRPGRLGSTARIRMSLGRIWRKKSARTASEIKKVVAHRKFGEVGLEVQQIASQKAKNIFINVDTA